MRIDEQWAALEAEQHNSSAGVRTRLARPSKGHPLHVGIVDGRRALLLRIPEISIPERKQWPDCHGLELQLLRSEEKFHIVVSLKDLRFSDVFSTLAEDLAYAVEGVATASEAISPLFGRLARWQRFLALSPTGIGEESQRGLWGELHFLVSYLLPLLGPSSIGAWRGPHGAHQDFQLSAGSIEVKTALGKHPQTVTITSERQLDGTNHGVLFLHVVSIEKVATGASLLDYVAKVRSALASDAISADTFEDSLLAAGYLDSHALKYADIRYAIRSEDSFRVDGSFPRIIEAILPPGIGNVSYALSIPACGQFQIETTNMLDLITTAAATRHD